MRYNNSAAAAKNVLRSTCQRENRYDLRELRYVILDARYITIFFSPCSLFFMHA